MKTQPEKLNSKFTTPHFHLGKNQNFKRFTSCVTALIIFVGSFFQPQLTAASAAPILGTPEIIAIIVELAAGQALDSWLNSNRYPIEDNTSASAVGAYYTGARYRMREINSPGPACPGSSFTPFTRTAYASQANERHTDPQGNPIDELKKRANLSGWMKTIEIIDDQGNCAHPRQWSVGGTSETPCSAEATLAYLQSVYDDPSLRLGNVLVDKTESWKVGRFVVYSDYSYSTALLHPKLKRGGYYPAEMYFEKQDVDYLGGKMTGVGPIIEDKLSFSLRADRPDTHYFDNLVGLNERLMSAPDAFGGMERWVEELKNVYECAYPNQPILHWFPSNNCKWVDKLVVKQKRALLPSELEN